ncbi:hypothetical protein N0V93_005079 [Gnomoniopsis smithogilvyi]|uniref:RRM domain-containing protein n=1 Tax=Gnomoniopsis smithogilvyi TaxID=1191159 RepID=A0A9W8YS87_9PEZI|nr:hypothetical protein N0V93_005079 [Gnomoniopsis smithogilvyi]
MKDYVRQVCDVDHVEIFQKSTSGWIRVKGRENFDKAYERLNGKEFNGRAIIADGRNSVSPILVRDLKVSARELMPQRFAQGGARDGYSMSMSSSGFMTSPETSFSQGHVAGGYDPYSTGFPPPPPYGYGTVQQSFVSTYHPPSSDGPQAMYTASAAYAVQPTTYHDYYPPSTSALTTQMSNLAIGNYSSGGGGGAGGGGGGGVIYTEQRGVHIRDISRRASEDQIRKMICDVTESEASLIEMIKIPVQDGTPRGHAFIHCRSASLAKCLVDHFHGHEFKGRKLQARLMKEGEAISSGFGAATPSPPPPSVKPQRSSGSGSSSSGKSSGSSSSISSGSRHHRHRKEDSERTERKERDSRAPEKGASKTVSSSNGGSKTVPLVVGGNLATASSSDSSSAVPAEKHGKKSSVVIADGSSGRRPSDTDSQ